MGKQNKNIKLKIIFVSLYIDHNANLLVVANGIIGISVISVKNEKSPELLTSYVNQSIKCGFDYCIITKDSDYIVCTCLERGTIIFDYRLKEKLSIISMINKIGTAYLEFSNDETHLFIANGF